MADPNLTASFRVRIARAGALWRKLAAGREGATVIEYVLIAALLGIAVLVGGTFLSEASTGAWEETILPSISNAFESVEPE